MSDAMNKLNIDVGDALRRGSNEVGLSDLSKMGLKKVKVIRHSQVNSLISESVDKAINKFLAGSVSQAEQQKLKALISKKESALMSDVSAEDQARLSNEVELLKNKLESQSALLAQAKEQVIEESKKEYERLAEVTSLENQLLQQKKTESDLRQQLQEMTVKVGDLKDKLQSQDSRSKEDQMKLQDLERLKIIEEEMNELDEENHNLKEQLNKAEQKLEIEREKIALIEKSAGDSRKGSEDLQIKIESLRQEKQDAHDQVIQLETKIKIISENSDELKANSAKKEDELRDAKQKLEISEKEKQELQIRVVELTREINEKQSNDQNAAIMAAVQQMMGEMKGMKGELADKIGKMRYSGGGGGGGHSDLDLDEVDASALMKSLFSSDKKMESNIGSVNLDNRKVASKKNMGAVRDKLKALKNLNPKKEEE